MSSATINIGQGSTTTTFPQSLAGSTTSTHSLSANSSTSSSVTPASSQTSLLSSESVSLASGALGHSAEPTASNQAPTALLSQGLHAPSKLVISLCAALAFISLVVIGLTLVCRRRRRRRRRLDALRIATSQPECDSPTEKDGVAERRGEGRFSPGGDTSPSSSEPTLTSQYRRASKSRKPFVLSGISSVNELSSPRALPSASPTRKSSGCCGLDEAEAETDSPAALILPDTTAVSEDALHADLTAHAMGELEGEEPRVGGHESDRYARSLPPPLPDTINSPPLISAQGHSATTPGGPAPTAHPPLRSLPPFNQHHDDEKDRAIPSIAETQQRAPGGQPSQEHPRSNRPPSTAARDTSIVPPLPLPLPLPLGRFSAGSPPHPRFVAVLMDLEPEVNSDSDAPPPYHPARLHDAPPGSTHDTARMGGVRVDVRRERRT
ncbi:hypothetical protein ACG7TL_008421 [Trametes sanguinea]